MNFDIDSVRIAGGIGADEPYWVGLAEGRFQLPRCRGCAHWTWPAHYRCGECGSWEFDWQEVDPTGALFTWTRSWYAFDRVRERAEDTPYVTALVEIDGCDGARVLGIYSGELSALTVGAPMRGTILPPSEKSKGYPSIQWSPAGGAA